MSSTFSSGTQSAAGLAGASAARRRSVSVYGVSRSSTIWSKKLMSNGPSLWLVGAFGGFGAKFDDNKQNQRAYPTVIQWQGGKQVTVFPDDAAGDNKMVNIGN